MTSFRVGQKVVCVEDTVIPPDIIKGVYPIVPIKASVYTIRDISIGELSKKPCLLFHEIPDEKIVCVLDGNEWVCTPMWEADCFRPLVERKTDISQFKAMLTSQTSKVPA
ncbi:hypothetical protein [Rhizobium rhizogenes]|uniref:hypothetical protein n=1 Tax=Rhizobium rhizogenes TaxID=359 RepID=UPI001573EE87|nr:hypothetical protein [Rhizobium rhizogenes]NTG07118.1 hypothetical protein [Rhizobium rhizogenes]